MLSASSLAACSGHGALDATSVDLGHLRGAGVGAFEDPTVVGARLVPERLDPGVLSGSEPDGAKRGLLSGFRVLSMPDGAIMVSDDRFAQAPQSSVAIPPRLGGGYLHVVGTYLYRSETWLSEVRPIYAAQASIQKVFVGLDRVYVRTAVGHAALDARTGAAKDLGPFPPGPQVVAYGARDGWRGAAIADLVGLVTTEDAGATWRRLDLGIDPRTVNVTESSRIVVTGLDGARQSVSYELREGGQAVRLGVASKPTAATKGKDKDKKDDPDPSDAPSKPPEVRAFGARPLVAAIEDGWPLTDGVALVARDGALARVRLDDGALLEAIPRAYPLSPSRCHGVSLHRPTAKGAFGFVCGEPRGRTDLYAYDPAAGKLVLLRRFDTPRAVLSGGQGTLAIKGSCAPEAPHDPPGQKTYCVLDYGNRFREVKVKGDVGAERLVVLADKRIAILSPPAGEVTTARITLLDERGAASTLPLSFPRVTADVARVLRYGVWLDGLEERRPGVLGAWIDAGGSVLGLEIGVDGNVKIGQYVREAGLPTVRGRYGFGMTNARRLFETTDGGMTWSPREAPEPLVPLANVTTRAVGPIGALAAGWLRVGWGPRDKKANEGPVKMPDPVRAPSHAPPSLTLACEPLARPAKAPAPEREASDKKPATKPGVTIPRPGTAPVVRPMPPPMIYLGASTGMRYPQELTAFFASAPPKLREGERPMLNVDAYDPFDRAIRQAPLVKVYAWGPKGPDPDPASRFSVRWLNPYEGYGEVHQSAPSTLPTPILDAMRGATTGLYPGAYGGMFSATWTSAIGDDASHALLALQLNGRPGLTLFELEADRSPLAVRREGGEDIQQVESAVRVEGKWVVSVPDASSAFDRSGTSATLFVIDGGTARFLARIPRIGPLEGSRLTGRLARRSDGRAVGYVVDASGPGSRGRAERWVVPIEIENGVVGEPASLGAPDYFDRPLGTCTGDEPGFVVDVPFSPNALRIRTGQGALGVQNPLVRMRLSSTSACMESAAGTLSVSDEKLVTSGGAKGTRPGIRVTTLVSGMRYPLSCSAAP